TNRPRVGLDANAVIASLLELGQLEHARLVVASGRQEIPDGVRPGCDLDAHRVPIAVPERCGVRVGDRIVDTKAVVARRAVGFPASAGRYHRQVALAGVDEQGAAGTMSGECVVVGVPVPVVEDAALEV